MDQSKKTMRHFYCRDVLWETFEQMANDFDCSIDYLINEAMRYYARSKNYQSAMATSGPMRAAARRWAAPAAAPPMRPPARAGRIRRRRRPTQPPRAGAARRAAHERAAAAAGRHAGSPRRSVAARRRPAPPQPRRRSRAAAAPAPAPMARRRGPTLFLIYNSQRYPVTKDQFIIGRGSRRRDLPIKDGNISRKHAAVIRRNGTFYIKDLGSTNGIDYKGMRIDNKRIDEGDVFHLCDYELRFTYRGD